MKCNFLLFVKYLFENLNMKLFSARGKKKSATSYGLFLILISCCLKECGRKKTKMSYSLTSTASCPESMSDWLVSPLWWDCWIWFETQMESLKLYHGITNKEIIKLYFFLRSKSQQTLIDFPFSLTYFFLSNSVSDSRWAALQAHNKLNQSQEWPFQLDKTAVVSRVSSKVSWERRHSGSCFPGKSRHLRQPQITDFW